MFDHLDSLLVVQISSFLRQLSCKIQRAAYNGDGSHALGALWHRLTSNFDRVDAINTSRFLIFFRFSVTTAMLATTPKLTMMKAALPLVVFRHRST